jgi:hypothetical protein
MGSKSTLKAKLPRSQQIFRICIFQKKPLKTYAQERNSANNNLRFGQNWIRTKFGNFTQMHEKFDGH